jgi:hypothetical protein
MRLRLLRLSARAAILTRRLLRRPERIIDFGDGTYATKVWRKYWAMWSEPDA